MKKLFLMLTVLMSACAAQSGSQNTVLPVSKESRTEIDKGWDLYMNPEYQFSMKIPKNIEAKTMSGYVNIGSWKIAESKVSLKDMDIFIKKTFGSDCIVKEIAPWYQEGIKQIVVIAGVAGDVFSGVHCLPAYSAWAILYNSKNELLVYWNQGQEDQFYGSGAIMNSSFRILE